MGDRIISFKTAKLAKEKGFKGACYCYYESNNSIPSIPKYTTGISQVSREDTYLAPTQSLLQKWLREKWKVHCNISLLGDGKWYGYAYDFNTDEPSIFGEGYYNSYEEALEAVLYEILKQF